MHAAQCTVAFRLALACALFMFAPIATAQTGRCCSTTGSCSMTTQAACAAGNWFSGGACTAGFCTPGACCAIDGTCAVKIQSACVAGAWLANGVCTFSVMFPQCAAPQACCTAGVCAVISPYFCAGVRGTASTPACPSNACALGTCCFGIGGCTVNTRIACGDYTWTSGATCSATTCNSPLMGTCCNGPTCTITLPPPFCAAGQWKAWKAVCAPDECFIATSQGTCCAIGGSCTITIQTGCAGSWGINLACSQPPCAAVSGACCSGATCSVLPIASCASLNMQFAGAGTSCNAVGVSGVPCCYADFNQSGSLAVQDIFDFINRWFAGDATARFGSDGSPGVLSVQNIFDFLNAWFAGGG